LFILLQKIIVAKIDTQERNPAIHTKRLAKVMQFEIKLFSGGLMLKPNYSMLTVAISLAYISGHQQRLRVIHGSGVFNVQQAFLV
jgi:hypothetical protein